MGTSVLGLCCDTCLSGKFLLLLLLIEFWEVQFKLGHEKFQLYFCAKISNRQQVFMLLDFIKEKETEISNTLAFVARTNNFTKSEKNSVNKI